MYSIELKLFMRALHIREVAAACFLIVLFPIVTFACTTWLGRIVGYTLMCAIVQTVKKGTNTFNDTRVHTRQTPI